MSTKPFATALAFASLAASLFTPALRADQGLITHKALSLDMSLAMAQGSIAKCRAMKYACAVVVLDASGRVLVSLQDDGASLHRIEVAHKKAYTALVYRRPSKEQVQNWSKKTQEGIPLQEGTLPSPPVEGTIAMGGGLPIMVDKDTIGAIAVSGGPNWDEDEACAKAGIAKVADKLK
jgi:uncharacterized protein GlcG (DUF336 family)